MKNFRFYLLLFAVYCLFAIAFTWPLIIRMSTSTYGYSGDNFGAIHYFWWWKYTKLHSLPVRDSFLEEVPFGVTLDREPGTIFYYLPVKIITFLTNEVFAYNLVLLLSFPLAAVSMYLLVFSVTGNRAASFISGLIFSFSPYHFWKAYNHLDLALIWTMPLYVWALLKIENFLGMLPRKRGWLLPLAAGFFLAATTLTNFYYGYFMLLFTAVYVLVRAFEVWLVEKRLYFTKRVFTFYFLLFVSASAAVLPFTFHVFADAKSSSSSSQSFLRRDSYHRPLLNLLSLSARPWDYLIPSQDHPVFGKYIPGIYEWIRTKSNDFKTISAQPHERTLYLGLTPTLLALCSLFFTLKSPRFKEKFGQTVLTFAVVAAVLFLISMPPYIFLRGQIFYLPSFFLYKIFPMFRTYARLGVVVLLCFSFLAGIALTWILERAKGGRKDSRTAHLFVLFIGFMILFEFLNIPPFKIVDFGQAPPEYQWLAKQPGDFSILEWPASFNLADALLFQSLHQKGFANWHSQSPYYDLWRSFDDLYDLGVTDKIAALGVKYVVVHKKLVFSQPNPVDDLWYTRAVSDPERYKAAPANMKLAADFNSSVIFEVDRSNPAKLITVVERPGAKKVYDICILGGDSWFWERSENRLYLINLVKKNDPRDLRVKVSFKIPNELKPLLQVLFNGEEIVNPWQPLELTLRPFENTLWFKAKEKTTVAVGNIKVEVLEETGQANCLL